jgi:hypothetical protein
MKIPHPATIILVAFFAWVNHLRFYSILTCLFEAPILTKIVHVFNMFIGNVLAKSVFAADRSGGV